MRKDSIPAIQTIELATKDDAFDLLQLLGVLWRGKWLALACMVLGIIAGGVYAFGIVTPLYSSSATVALDNRDSQVVDFDSVVSGLSVDKATVNTEVEVLRARILIGKLVDQENLLSDAEFNEQLRPESSLSPGAILQWLGLSGPPRERSDKEIRDRVVDAVLAAVSISNVRDSYVFRIYLRTEDPEKSAHLADRLAELYISDQLNTKFQATEQATVWLTERVSELKIELEAAETRVKEYNSSIDLVGPAALNALNRQLKDIRSRLINAERDVAGHAKRIAAMEAARESGDLLAMGSAAGDEFLIANASLAANDAQARTAFISRFEQKLAQIHIARSREAAQIVAMRDSVIDIETRVEAQSADLVRLQQLEREAAASGLIYEYFLSRLKETSVQQGIQQADARILSYAVIAEKPSVPRTSMVLGMAAMLGLFAGMGLTLAREMRQTGFRNAEDLERATGVTVIGQIPRAPTTRRKRLLDYILTKPTSALVEAVRNLRTSILLSDIDKPPRVIMLTSSVPGEGKTMQSLALAQNFSGLGRRVLIVEGDIRRRTFREYFDIQGKRGLLSAVSGDAKLEDVVWHDEGLGADILIGEESTVNAADFFSSKKFTKFLSGLRETYDVVLIDTPPVLIVPDARVIAQHADAVVYIVRWDKTPRAQVEQGLHAFATVNAPVTGLVLNQINPKGMKRYGEAYTAHGQNYYDN